MAGEEQDAQLQEAQTAFDEANTLWDAGKYADAMARGERALARREAVLGGIHPDVAKSLALLGFHYLLQGNPGRAEPLLQRALAIQEATLGKNHPAVAQTLTHLANLYLAQELYERVEPLYTRALTIREAAFGENHPLSAESLNNLARLISQQQASPARAEPLLLRALAIREAAFGKDHPDVAQTLNDLAMFYCNQGAYTRAEPLLQRALAIREAAFGKDHPDVTQTLRCLAALYEVQGLYARAEPFHVRVQALLEAALDKNRPDIAASLLDLAGLCLHRGWLVRAGPLFERALAVQEATLGKSHHLVAITLLKLAATYSLQGLSGRAEPLLQRALAISEAALDKRHPFVADLVVRLGNIYMAQGLYARAEPLLQRALAIRHAAFSEKSPQVALALGSLGSLYMAQGLYTRAEPFLQRALAIQEELAGKSDPYVARQLSNLGKLYLAQGLYRRAEPLLQRALTITEAVYGPNDPDVADSLHDLAGLYSAQGLYARARPLYERVLAIREATFGKNSPRNAETLNQLALAYLTQHRLAEALPLLTRALAISEQRLREETLGLSEVNLARFLQLLRADEERLYALVRAHPDNASVRRLALSAALLLKGRSVEESSNISRVIYRGMGAQDRDTLERLNGLRAQLAQLSLQGPGSLSLPAYQQHLDELSEQAAALESDLAQRSAPLRALAELPSPADIVDRVAAALPKDGALIELVAYADTPLVREPNPWEPPVPSPLRYLALVLFPDGRTGAVDLGPAAPIEEAASQLRDALARRDAAYLGPAQEIDALAFRPLLPLLGKVHRLFLAPDGQLGLVPFEAFHDGRRFRIDTFDFSYLTSGKELLPRPEDIPPAGSVVVLADPDFDTPAPPLSPTEGAPALAERSFPVEDSVLTLRSVKADQPWVPLPGTRQEAEALRRLLPQAQVFLGRDASKERLLHLTTPGILHIATHGFFLGDATTAPQGARAVTASGPLGGEGPAPQLPDPLLRSGLVLAGARAPSASSGEAPSRRLDDSLVTALELSGLNLWGTELVVLSACDTGRGDVTLGQGVYGLRRALVVAGAETLVMSLWKVNDETTHPLMESYYRNLLAGKGRATSLRQAMLALRRKQPHPHFWAPFVTIGRDAPLRTLAPLLH